MRHFVATLVIIAHLAFMWVTQTMGGIHFSIARHWQPLMDYRFQNLSLAVATAPSDEES
jgi:hypothetical protein